jgi:hypothetical protein
MLVELGFVTSVVLVVNHTVKSVISARMESRPLNVKNVVTYTPTHTLIDVMPAE